MSIITTEIVEIYKKIITPNFVVEIDDYSPRLSTRSYSCIFIFWEWPLVMLA